MSSEILDTVSKLSKRQQRHGDLVLVPFELLRSNKLIKDDCQLESELVEAICGALKCRRLAAYHHVDIGHEYRIPKVTLINTQDPIVTHIDNGVTYKFDVTKNMFSIGNIAEKIRVSKLDCQGEVIVDMFAGIGYFTLQFLFHTNPVHVYAIDWNAQALQCLKSNLTTNKIPENKVTILCGDNREVCPVGVADRVYLGLIPTSKMSWQAAIMALKVDTGGILHIHENVSLKSPPDCEKMSKKSLLDSWGAKVVQQIQELFPGWNVESLGYFKVKSFAPGILHMVIDIELRPIT